MISILDSTFIISAVKPVDYPSAEFSDIGFVGKSNVGKSSMINTLLNRRMLVKVSSTPGKTRLLNFFKIRFRKEDDTKEIGYFNIVDFPGYGYAKVSHSERESWKNMIHSYFIEREQLRGLVILVDIRHDADPKDQQLLEMVKNSNITYLVVATKSDKIPKTKIHSYLTSLALGLQIERSKIISFSSLKKTGIKELLSWIENRII